MPADIELWTTVVANLATVAVPVVAIGALGYRQLTDRFHQIDQRFERVHRRFEKVDQRFEKVDKRISALEVDVRRIDTTVSLLMDAEQERDPGFYDRLKLFTFGQGNPYDPERRNALVDRWEAEELTLEEAEELLGYIEEDLEMADDEEGLRTLERAVVLLRRLIEVKRRVRENKNRSAG